MKAIKGFYDQRVGLVKKGDPMPEGLSTDAKRDLSKFYQETPSTKVAEKPANKGRAKQEDK